MGRWVGMHFFRSFFSHRFTMYSTMYTESANGMVVSVTEQPQGYVPSCTLHFVMQLLWI